MILPDLLRLTIRRLWSRPILTLLALLGVVLAVGLLSSSAFFTQAVDRVLLLEELNKLAKTTGRHPFATRVYVFPTGRQPLSLAQAELMGKDVAGALAGEIGLPVARLGLSVESIGLMLLPSEDDLRYNPNKILNQVTLNYIGEVADKLTLVSGDHFPTDAESEATAAQAAGLSTVLDVWMHTRVAQEMGVQAGEKYRITVNLSKLPHIVRVRGLWQAKEPTDPFWFNNPDQNLKTALLISRLDYIRFAEPMMASKAGAVYWPITLDDGALNPANARQYAAGYERGMSIIRQFLPDARLDLSALDPLEKFVLRQSTLTTTLLSFNVPALCFLLAFLVLIALIVADWQRRETAVLVSRGMSTSSVLGLLTLEEGLLYLLGVPLGIGFGMWLAGAMGNTLSFLAFIARDPLPISLQGLDLRLVSFALVFAFSARLIPTLQAARQSVVTEERSRIRPLRPPWFQRVYLDFLLILPTWYTYRQLELRGSLGALVTDKPEELFQDPLLILLPALIVFCAALLAMRLFFLLMRLFDLIARRVRWVPLHLSLRQLSRAGQYAITPLLLIVVALALGIYTIALAASLDQWLIDRIYYRVGSDLSFLPMPLGSNSSESSSDEPVDMSWVPTNTEFSELAGVKSAGRVGRYPLRLPGQGDDEVRGHFLGVDRADFATIAWFRRDFADQSLGALMNLLALDGANVLVPQLYLDLTKRRLGETISLQVTLDDLVVTEEFKIVGAYHYFPTVYEDDPTIIGNLDQLFLLAGLDFPYNVWIQTDESAQVVPVSLQDAPTRSELLRKVEDEMGLDAGQPRDAHMLVAQEQAKFERVGIYGTLSVGFLAATGMAVLALLIYSYASLQERLYQFGVLRAIGLRKRQVLSQVVIEYGILILFGALAGWWIGVQTVQLFAPFFRITGVSEIALPPLLPVIPQNQIMMLVTFFAVTMIAVETLVIASALAGRLFNVLRMGHQG